MLERVISRRDRRREIKRAIARERQQIKKVAKMRSTLEFKQTMERRSLSRIAQLEKMLVELDNARSG